MPSPAGHHSTSSAGRLTVNRRGFLRTSLGASAGLLAAPTLVTWLAAADAKAATSPAAFVDDYTTNVLTNLTPETNAVVRILGGMAEVWKTGGAWNTGTPLMPEVLRANMRYCARITAARTDAQAKEAFIYDRQHQSYAIIAGMGPLADLYKSGAQAVTSITSAPDGTPPGRSTTPCRPVPRPVPRSARARTTRRSARWPSWSTPCAATTPRATRPSTRTSTRVRGA